MKRFKAPAIAAMMAVFLCSAAIAAERSVTKSMRHGVHTFITDPDNPVATGDTVANIFWPGGKGILFVSGTLANAEFKMVYDPWDGSNLQDIDNDNAEDGLYFSSANGVENIPLFELAPGYIGIEFTSAGTSAQSLQFIWKENRNSVRNLP